MTKFAPAVLVRLALLALLALPRAAAHDLLRGGAVADGQDPNPSQMPSLPPDCVMIKGKKVCSADHVLAPAGELTLLVEVLDEDAAKFLEERFDQAVDMPGVFFAINVQEGGADAVITELEANEHVKFVELDEKVEVPPHEQLQTPLPGSSAERRLAEEVPYGIDMVLEDRDWWRTIEGPSGSSKICVVDTGYDVTHPDLPALDETTDGLNAYSWGKWSIDGHGHGTHCAGTIGAIGDSDGVVGVIPGDLGGKFSFHIGKGLGDGGGGTSAGVMKAVQACVDAGSNVISMSLGGGGYSSIANDLYEKFYKDDVLIIAAAGNDGNSALSYPASYSSVMSVAAVDQNGNKAYFSQFNDQVDIAAPGVGVKSTYPGNRYATWSGTSMATPHVAGVAGLLRAYFPTCRAFQIRRAMLATAQDKGGCNDQYGFGIIRAKTAYEFLQANPCDTAESFKEPKGGCAANTISCLNGLSPVTLELTTDNYPGETSWDFKDSSSGHVLAQGSGYTKAMDLNEIIFCVEEGVKATFKITDSWGDGICCGYGRGGYKILVNGAEVESGGAFGSEETKTIMVSPVVLAKDGIHPSMKSD